MSYYNSGYSYNSGNKNNNYNNNSNQRSNQHLQEFSLSTSFNDYNFDQIESYKINNDECMIDKVAYSYNKSESEDGYNIVNFLLLIKSNLKLLVCNYSKREYAMSKPKLYTVNTKLEDPNIKNKLKIIRMIYSRAANTNIVFLSTSNEVFYQYLDDIKCFNSIFNIENIGVITDLYCFELKEEVEPNKYTYKLVVFVIVNNKILVELNPLSTNPDLISASFFANFRQEKLDPKRFQVTNFDTSINIKFFPYQVIKSIDQTRFFQNMISFDNNPSINHILIRPNGIKGKNNYTMSFEGGFVGVFHYESHALVSIYKTSYGEIQCMDFSKDGKLLAIGCEDDNIYIADAEKNLLLYSLQGHDNYVSSVCFEDNIEESEINQKCLNSNNQTSTSNSNSTSLNNKKIYDDKVEIDVIIESLINISLSNEENIVNLCKSKNNRIYSNKNLNLLSQVNILSNYSLFSSSLDGSIATWQIDHCSEKGYSNKSNYINIDNSKTTCKLDSFKIISLDVSKENLLTPISKIKICPVQIFRLIVCNNILVYQAKMNHEITDIYFRVFFSKYSNHQEITEKYKTDEESTNISKTNQDMSTSMISYSKNKGDTSVISSTTSTAIKVKKNS